MRTFKLLRPMASSMSINHVCSAPDPSRLPTKQTFPLLNLHIHTTTGNEELGIPSALP